MSQRQRALERRVRAAGRRYEAAITPLARRSARVDLAAAKAASEAHRLFVLGGGLLFGALVAAASHAQMSGAWPAFVIGAGAPATIRGLLSGVEVRARPSLGLAPVRPAIRERKPAEEEGSVRMRARACFTSGGGRSSTNSALAARHRFASSGSIPGRRRCPPSPTRVAGPSGAGPSGRRNPAPTRPGAADQTDANLGGARGPGGRP